MNLANNKGTVVITYAVFLSIYLGLNGEEYYKFTSFKRAKKKPIWGKKTISAFVSSF